MANIRTLKLNLLADVSDFNTQLDAASSKFGKFSKKLDSLSRKSAVAFGAIAFAGKIAVDAASDLNESLSKSVVVFGDSSKAIEDFANTAAKELGISKTAALEAASNFAIFGKAAGLSGTDLTGFSTDLLTLASDFASFNNVSIDTAITAIGAGLRGESEPLRQFGVLMTAADVEAKALAMGLGDASGAITEQDKVLARQAIILEQTTLQQGDFARTSEGAANQQRILTAQIEDAKSKIGQGLLPVYQTLISLIVPIIDYFSQHSEVMSKVILVVGALTGAIVALNYIVKTATILQDAYNLVLKMNPIGLVIIAIGLLIAALVYAYENFEPFTKAVDALWDAMKRVGAYIKDALVGYFSTLFDIVKKVYDVIKNVIDAVANSSIGKALGGIISSVTGSRAAGGSVSAGQSYRVGEFGSEIFTPNSSGVIRKDSGGGGGNTFILNGIIDAESARRSIEKVLQDSSRRTGAINLVGATL